jgi:3-hydroxyacyl-[acyl-carrier protein] dehydratase/trans-2-decenoyl-[acyl-carrier protein] isomerase
METLLDMANGNTDAPCKVERDWTEPMSRPDSFDKDALLQCGRGELFGPGNAQLPMPPMLMFDRITQISNEGGKHGHGEVIAEQVVTPDSWFFDCHFPGDPVMPGCLGLDALWQLLGFYLAWNGHPGHGRALGVKEVKFRGQILPTAKRVTYRLDIERLMASKLVLGIADGAVAIDDRVVYTARGLRVGLFTSTDNF